MKYVAQQIPSSEESTNQIFELSGAKFEPDVAANLWPLIIKHKWLLSEKLGRDVGLRIACIDFLKNIEQALAEYMIYNNELYHKIRDIYPDIGECGIDVDVHSMKPTSGGGAI